MAKQRQRVRRVRPPWEFARLVLKKVVEHPANKGARARAVARSLAWQVYKRAVGHPLRTRVHGGGKFVLHCDSGSASNVVYFRGRFDYHEMAFLERFLRRGDAVLDIGANIGFYAIFMRGLVGEDGFVEAFEPYPLNYARTLENVALNGFGNVRVHPFAVSDEPGMVEFVSDMDVSNRIATRVDGSASVTRVQSVRIDDVIGPRPFAFAKLDVEGAEMMALRGANGHLSAANPAVWQVEMMPSLLAKQDTSPEAVAEHLAGYGYRLGYFDADEGGLRYDAAAYRHRLNVLAVHESRIEMVERRLSEGAL